MLRVLIRWSFVLVPCVLIGCGSSSGIQPGIPSDTTPAPVNPTPDMAPNPKPAKI